MTKPLALATLLEPVDMGPSAGKLRPGTFNLGLSNLVTGTPSVGDTISYSVTGAPVELFTAVGGSAMPIGGQALQSYPQGQPYQDILLGPNVYAVELTSNDPAWNSLPDLTAYNEQTVTINYMDLNNTPRTLQAKIIDDPSLFMVPAGSARKIIFYDNIGGADVGFAFQGPDGIDQIVQILGPASGDWAFTPNSVDTSTLITSATIDSAFSDVIGAEGSPITATHDTLAELENFVSSVSGDIATSFPEFYAPSGRVYSKVYNMGDIIQNGTHNVTIIENGTAFRFDDRATGGTCNIDPKMLSVSRNGVRQLSNFLVWGGDFDYKVGTIVPASGGSEVFQSDAMSGQLHSVSFSNFTDAGNGRWTFEIPDEHMSWAGSIADQTAVTMYLYHFDGTTPYAMMPSVSLIRENPLSDPVMMAVWSMSGTDYNNGYFTNWLQNHNEFPGEGWSDAQDMKTKFSTGGGTPASFTEVPTQDGSVGDIYFPNGLSINDRLVIRSF